jgi:hypothetical protein
MNSMALPQPSTRSRRIRVSDEMWDGFDAPRRARRTAGRMSQTHSKAALPHAHLTFAESPAMYLREEMV